MGLFDVFSSAKKEVDPKVAAAAAKVRMSVEEYQKLQVERERRRLEQEQREAQELQSTIAHNKKAVESSHKVLLSEKHQAHKSTHSVNVGVAAKDSSLASGSRDRSAASKFTTNPSAADIKASMAAKPENKIGTQSNGIKAKGLTAEEKEALLARRAEEKAQKLAQKQQRAEQQKEAAAAYTQKIADALAVKAEAATLRQEEKVAKAQAREEASKAKLGEKYKTPEERAAQRATALKGLFRNPQPVPFDEERSAQNQDVAGTLRKMGM